MISLIQFLVRPARASAAIKERPRWLAAFIILAASTIVIEHFLQPHMFAALLRHLPPSVTPRDWMTIRQNLIDGEIVRLLFLPIRLLFGWTMFALLLYVVCRVIVPKEPFRFQQVLSLAVHAESVTILEKLATLLAFTIDPGRAGADAFLPLTARIFLPSDDFVRSAFLDSLTPFSVLSVLLLTIGLSIVCRIGRWKASGISTAAWLISRILNVAFLELMREEFHFVM